jgi:hypothetical protein
VRYLLARWLERKRCLSSVCPSNCLFKNGGSRNGATFLCYLGVIYEGGFVQAGNLIHLRQNTFAFVHDEYTVNLRDSDHLLFSTRPLNFDFIRRAGSAKPEVHTRI